MLHMFARKLLRFFILEGVDLERKKRDPDRDFLALLKLKIPTVLETFRCLRTLLFNRLWARCIISLLTNKDLSKPAWQVPYPRL